MIFVAATDQFNPLVQIYCYSGMLGWWRVIFEFLYKKTRECFRWVKINKMHSCTFFRNINKYVSHASTNLPKPVAPSFSYSTKCTQVLLTFQVHLLPWQAYILESSSNVLLDIKVSRFPFTSIIRSLGWSNLSEPTVTVFEFPFNFFLKNRHWCRLTASFVATMAIVLGPRARFRWKWADSNGIDDNEVRCPVFFAWSTRWPRKCIL